MRCYQEIGNYEIILSIQHFKKLNQFNIERTKGELKVSFLKQLEVSSHAINNTDYVKIKSF